MNSLLIPQVEKWCVQADLLTKSTIEVDLVVAIATVLDVERAAGVIHWPGRHTVAPCPDDAHVATDNGAVIRILKMSKEGKQRPREASATAKPKHQTPSKEGTAWLTTSPERSGQGTTQGRAAGIPQC